MQAHFHNGIGGADNALSTINGNTPHVFSIAEGSSSLYQNTGNQR
jgi:hypothetical protein